MKAFRYSLLAGAAALQLTAQAQAVEFSSDAQLSFAGGDVQNNNGNDFTGDVENEWTVGARFGAQFANSFYAQVDGHYVEGEGYDPSPGSAGSDFDGHSLTAHLGWRPGNNYLGAFYSYQYANEITSSSDYQEFDTWGAEGQVHEDKYSLHVQAGYAEVRDNEIGEWHDVAFVRGGVSYFFDSNLSVSVDAFYGSGQVESIDDAPLLHLSLEARKRFAASPFSAFARYEHGDFRNEGETPNDILRDDVFRLGLAFSWGSETLQDQQQHGPSLSAPHQMLRYMGYSDQFD